MLIAVRPDVFDFTNTHTEDDDTFNFSSGADGDTQHIDGPNPVIKFRWLPDPEPSVIYIIPTEYSDVPIGSAGIAHTFDDDFII